MARRCNGAFPGSNLTFEAAPKARTMFGVRAVLKLLLCSIVPAAVLAGEARLLDGRVLEGALRFNDTGALVVQSSSGESTTVELNQLSRATFASGLFFGGGATLPNGWVATDLGDARGAARLDTNTFTLRVEGRSTNIAAGHFVSRPMISDGNVLVRVDEIGGGRTHAGVMIRAHHSSVFAALTLGSDGRIEFQRRTDPDQRAVRVTVGAKATAPVWLRLQLLRKELTAFYAFDGRSWEQFASEPFKLSAERTWRESEGELHLLRANVGALVSSRGAGTVGTARVSPLLLMQNGLVGEYFDGRDFTNLKMARLDPQVRFDWKSGPPDPSLNATNFCVRWTGKIISKTTRSYTFHLDGWARARLWLNNQETPLHPFAGFAWDEKNPPITTPLMGGVNTEFRLEYEQNATPATVKLGWAWPRQQPEVIGQTNFFHHFTGTKSPESIALARTTNSGPVVRGVMLRNGTFLAGTITKADESAVRLAFAGRAESPILNSRVARLVLRPPRTPLPYGRAQGRRGVFTKTGDFLECDFRSLERDTLTVSSVLFGLKGYRVEDGPFVVVLNDVAEENSGHEVRLLDGSVLRAKKLRAAPASLTVTDSLLGDLVIPSADLFEIRALGVNAAVEP